MKSKKVLTNFVLGMMLIGFGANVVSGATNEADVVAEIRSTIASVREEIKYLDDKYSRDDAEWLEYKADVETLFQRCEKALTQKSIDVGTLNKLMDDLNKIDRKLLMKLPAGPQGPGHFGAYYTKLKYYSQWDRYWRVGQFADVVVQFDDAGHKFIFWRGTNYIPHWVTENGIWYNNEFNEAWETVGSCEPMSDKQCRYSHVRVIESNPARVVVHWRYALADVNYRIAWPDEETGWGDWSDEYYTIYPDAVGVRHIILHSSHWGDDAVRHTDDVGHEWHEGIVVYNAHSRPEESVEIDAVHVANMKGEIGKWSWETPGKPTTPTPEGSNIVLMNVKSKTKPFVVSPEGCRLFAYEGSQGGSHFRWRDHWPTTLEPVTGRDASGEQAAHGSFFHIARIPIYQQGDDWVSKVHLHGMTRKTAGELAPLAKSWLYPVELKLNSNNFTTEGFDKAQRAYVLTCKKAGKPSKLKFQLVAGKDKPVINPAFVVKNWGTAEPELKVNGEKASLGKDFRAGYEKTLRASNLIIWLRAESVKPMSISLSPVGG